MSIDIPKNEQGVIRVFSVSRAPAEVTGAIDTNGKAAVARDLLEHDLPERGFELFPVADLAGVGLARYLSDGYAVPDAELSQHQTRLDALDGYVLLVFSQAFDAAPATLTPGPDLTLIGTFGETKPDMRSAPLDSEAAQIPSGTPRQTPVQQPKGRPGSLLVIAAVIVLLLAILLLVLN